MRVPKYKAWDKKTKQIVEVIAIVFSDFQIEDDCDSKLGDPTIDAGVWIYVDEECLFEEHREFDQVELMEYTGRKDKNSKEIYSGHFLKYVSRKYPLSSGIYLVSWCEDELAFICERKEPYNYLLPSVWSECEIIETIYANKELMNKK